MKECLEELRLDGQITEDYLKVIQEEDSEESEPISRESLDTSFGDSSCASEIADKSQTKASG
jgi:hypothetical protein